MQSTRPPIKELSPIKRTVKKEETWEVRIYESYSKEGFDVGLVLPPPNESEPIRYALPFTFSVTNNEAKYEALITSLCLARGVGVTSIKVNCDSQLVVNQVKEEYQANGKMMKKYLTKAKTLI